MTPEAITALLREVGVPTGRPVAISLLLEPIAAYAEEVVLAEVVRDTLRREKMSCDINLLEFEGGTVLDLTIDTPGREVVRLRFAL